MPYLRIALSQVNVTVGDLTGNRARILEGILRAKAWRADVVVFPELAVTGYPPEDLLLKPAFIQENLKTLRSIAPYAQDVMVVVGFVDRNRRGRLYDAAAVLAQGRHVGTYRKQCLPNYGVFDEKRYFTPGAQSLVLRLSRMRLGVTICEDLWEPHPAQALAHAGCQALVNLSASPYYAGKQRLRQQVFARRARANRLAVAYCNLVGGQDELVFDGSSVILDARGQLVAQGRQFQEDVVLADLELGAALSRTTSRSTVWLDVPYTPHQAPRLAATRRTCLEPPEEIYEALVLGTRDYVRKNGFETVVLGLSGGIDSSLTACVAVDALGADHVVGVTMPSRFSSLDTQEDARGLADTLGIRCHVVGIETCFAAYLETLKGAFGGQPHDVTEQNLQARIRGNLLMALSNKYGWLVLTTGNKSEMATGYCTLYGDMAGGFGVIKDVPKTLVYQLARLRNRRRVVIPARVFTRAPTAELAPGQTDQDTLPPYDVLDRILKAYVENDRSLQEIAARDHLDREVIRRVVRMVDHSEYKRRQSPPGVKITPKAFGRDRRMPITNRYHSY